MSLRASSQIRLPDSAHTSRPWRIHEIAGDFKVEDVWTSRERGSPEDFPAMVEMMTTTDPAKGSSRIARALWATRWKLGEVLGWDDPGAGIGTRVPSLRDRLPPDLRAAPKPEFEELPFTSLYLIEDEFAAEIANKTVHGVMHLGWVPEENGGCRVQMAVLVKPNGLWGRAYMAAIRPFRHLLVYPPMFRDLERRWRARSPSPSAAGGRAAVG